MFLKAYDCVWNKISAVHSFLNHIFVVLFLKPTAQIFCAQTKTLPKSINSFRFNSCGISPECYEYGILSQNIGAMRSKLFYFWEKSINSAELLSLSPSKTVGAVELKCFHTNE